MPYLAQRTTGISNKISNLTEMLLHGLLPYLSFCFLTQKSVQKKSYLGDFVCLGLKSSVHFEQAEGGSGNERGDPAFGSALW